MTTIIIQPDLKLLGEMFGTEAQLQVRQGIIEAFAERHLKALANGDTIKTAAAMITKTIQAEISAKSEQHIGKITQSWGGERKLELNDLTKRTISIYVRDQITEAVNVAINERLRILNVEVQNNINYKINQFLTAYTDAALQHTVKEAVDAKLKAIAKSIK